MAPMHEIDVGQRLHCAELMTGAKLTGTFVADAEGIRIRLISFGDRKYVNADTPIFLVSEKSQIISLHNNFNLSHESGHFSPEDKSPILSQEIGSNLAIVGPDKWTDQDRIKRIMFTVTGALVVLRNNEALENFKSFERPPDYNWRLIDTMIGDDHLTAYYVGRYTSELDTFKEIEPQFEIEFAEPILVSEYERRIMPIVWFIGLLTSSPAHPEKIRITRFSYSEKAYPSESGLSRYGV